MRRHRIAISNIGDLLERAATAARHLPTAEQDDVARVVLELAGTAAESSHVALLPKEQAASAVSNQQAARGEFAIEEQVRAIWVKHGL